MSWVDRETAVWQGLQGESEPREEGDSLSSDLSEDVLGTSLKAGSLFPGMACPGEMFHTIKIWCWEWGASGDLSKGRRNALEFEGFCRGKNSLAKYKLIKKVFNLVNLLFDPYDVTRGLGHPTVVRPGGMER